MYDAPSEPSDNDNVIPTTTSSYIQLVCYPRSGKTAIQVFHNTGAIDSEDSEMCGSEAIHLAGHAAHSDRSICPSSYRYAGRPYPAVAYRRASLNGWIRAHRF